MSSWGDRKGDGGKGGDRSWGAKGGDNRGYGDNRGGGKGDNRSYGGGGKGDRPSWGNRYEDRRQEDAPQQYSHSLEASFGTQRTEPLKNVQIDALVILQIMKHCRQHSPHAVTGQLLGLDVDDTLQVSHCFGYIQRSGADEYQSSAEDGQQYQMETLRRLREVNVDSNTVGWYQTTHLGQFYSTTVIETQFLYQTEIPRSVLIVYDSLQSAIGKTAFKALQLTAPFMKAYGEASEQGRAAMADFPTSEMFTEVPVAITSSVIAESFLLDWAIADPIATTSQVDVLDLENQAFLEKNVQLLMGSLQDLADEQQKMINFERQAARKGEGGKGEKGGKGFQRQPTQPRQLDTMIISQQIKNYCKAINTFSADAFGKLYLVSNKPDAVKKA